MMTNQPTVAECATLRDSMINGSHNMPMIHEQVLVDTRKKGTYYVISLISHFGVADKEKFP
jgi:hypothetical protein